MLTCSLTGLPMNHGLISVLLMHIIKCILVRYLTVRCIYLATVANHGQSKGLVLHAEGPLSFTTYFYHPSLSARRQGTVICMNLESHFKVFQALTYRVCLETGDSGADGTKLFPHYPNLLGDRQVTHLCLGPHYTL